MKHALDQRPPSCPFCLRLLDFKRVGIWTRVTDLGRGDAGATAEAEAEAAAASQHPVSRERRRQQPGPQPHHHGCPR